MAGHKLASQCTVLLADILRPAIPITTRWHLARGLTAFTWEGGCQALG